MSNKEKIRGQLIPIAGIRITVALTSLLGVTSAFGRTNHELAGTDDFVRQAIQRPGNAPLHLIVRTSHVLSTKEEAQFARLGGYVYRHLPIIDADAVSVPARRVKELLKYSFVEHVSSDVEVRKSDAYTVGASGASTAWQQYGTSGKGIGVAIVDSGIRTGGDLGTGGLFPSRIVGSMNFALDSLTTDDLCGHGTHVAGIVGGSGSLSTGERLFANLLRHRSADEPD